MAHGAVAELKSWRATSTADLYSLGLRNSLYENLFLSIAHSVDDIVLCLIFCAAFLENAHENNKSRDVDRPRS